MNISYQATTYKYPIYGNFPKISPGKPLYNIYTWQM